jgi:hypothetical protein
MLDNSESIESPEDGGYPGAFAVQLELASSLITSIADPNSRMAAFSFSMSRGEQVNLLGQDADYISRASVTDSTIALIRSHGYYPGSGTDLGGAIARSAVFHTTI